MSKKNNGPRLSGRLAKEMRLLPGYILVGIWVLFTFALLGWVLCASLSTTPEIFAAQVGKFPSGLHFENFAKAWGSQNVSRIFGNSLVYSLISCVILIVICAPCAYVLSRFKFFGNAAIQSGFVAAMGVPVAMIVLPLFCVIAQLHLVDNGIRNGWF